MTKNAKELDYFFKPESIVIIGASDVEGAFGSRYLKALIDIGFKGKLYAVNHKGDESFGLEIYRSVLDIPDLVELACLCVSAMVQENPEIKEMDINPLFAYENKAVAVDARIILEDDAV